MRRSLRQLTIWIEIQHTPPPLFVYRDYSAKLIFDLKKKTPIKLKKTKKMRKKDEGSGKDDEKTMKKLTRNEDE